MKKRSPRLRFIQTTEGLDPEAGAGGAGGDGGKPAEKTFTQAELTAIAAREKSEGKAAAERAIAEQLGVSIEEAKAIITQTKEAADAKKSEADKDREAAATEKAAAEQAKAEAQREVHQARLERAFAKVGLDMEDQDDAKTARIMRLVTVEPGASYEDVRKDVEAIKADFPALFGTDGAGEQQQQRKAPGGDPAGRPPAPKPGEDKFKVGQERAKSHRARFAQRPLKDN